MAAPLASLLPVPGSKRADLLGLKLKLATALAPEQGKTYWTALVAFCTGRLNRDELGLVLSAVLGPDTVPLHNALLLAILYNTTRPTLPSSQRHPGWHTRKRDPSGRKVEDSDPKRRRLKAAVMALGKRERADIKALSPERPEPTQLAHGFDSKGAGRPSPDPSDDELQQEYLRCLQAPLCCESKLLPDLDTLRDRMSLVAYESHLNEGADSNVAHLASQALELHLKSMISSVISLIRANRAAGIQTSSAKQLSLLAEISDPEGLPSASEPPAIILSDTCLVPSSTLFAPPEQDDYLEAPLSLKDFSSLFEISPFLLVQPHVAAVEKLYALPSDESDSSSSSSDDDDERENQSTLESKREKLESTTSSRIGSRVNRSKSLSNGTGGREQYVIDPAAIFIPIGHPDVPAHPFNLNGITSTLLLPLDPRTTTTKRLKKSTTEENEIVPLSPISLQSHLFPDSESSLPPLSSIPLLARPKIPVMEDLIHSPADNTSTDGTEDSDEDHPTHAPPYQQQLGGRELNLGSGVGMGKRTGGGGGRKLYDVVDSHQLLEGVLFD